MRATAPTHCLSTMIVFKIKILATMTTSNHKWMMKKLTLTFTVDRASFTLGPITNNKEPNSCQDLAI